MENWHYKDEQSGERLGPVAMETVAQLIVDKKIERDTLVWNPSMTEWARASTTNLLSFFSDSPPPLPISEINRWPIYAVATFPLWGSLIQGIVCYTFSYRFNLTVEAMIDSKLWHLFHHWKHFPRRDR